MIESLTARERIFVEEYLLSLKPEESAIKAGYAKTTAAKKSFGWVTPLRKDSTKPHIWDAVNQAKQERSERTKIDADWVLTNLVAMFETSSADFLTIPEDGRQPFFDLRNAPKEKIAMLDQLQIETYTEGRGDFAEEVKRIKITLPSKLSTLKLIGDHIGVQAFKTVSEVHGSKDNPLHVNVDSKEIAAALASIASKL